MGNAGADPGDRERFDIRQRQRGIAVEPAVLGGDLAGLVLKLPGRISEDRGEPLVSGECEKIGGGRIIRRLHRHDRAVIWAALSNAPIAILDKLSRDNSSLP